MVVGWNLTSRRSRFKESDIYIFSIAKSGRTWLRVLINKYLSLAYNVSFKLDDLSRQEKSIPSILFTHELWEHHRKATRWQKVLGKYVIPENMLRSKKIIVLYRDPRDVLVSLYFHMRKRSDRRIKKDITDLISNRQYGLPLIIQVMNQWRNRLEDHPDCFWISYETLKQETLSTFLSVLNFLGLPSLREDLARQAVEFAQFDNMKKMEARGEFGAKIIKPGIPSDPDSFKVRKGKVGGYVNHFSDENLQRIDRVVATLHPFYNYYAKSS
jgi:hypothetical protein